MTEARAIEVVNIKEDMPSVDEARRRLKDEIERARARGVGVLKVVHGYGSSGVGGALRGALRKSLSLRKKEGLIREVIHGEKWDIFDPRVTAVLDRFPSLRRDPDLARSNEGVTIVVL